MLEITLTEVDNDETQWIIHVGYVVKVSFQLHLVATARNITENKFHAAELKSKGELCCQSDLR